MVSVERVNKRDKSEKTQKTDGKLGYEKELEIEEPEKEGTEEHETTSDNGEPKDKLSIVEFEDPMYELSQSYELKPEYENMTVDQEQQKFKPCHQSRRLSTKNCLSYINIRQTSRKR